jgi:hypothetical protein
MKKIIIGLLAVTVLVSCHKTRACECKDAQGNVLGTDHIRASKKDAKEICEDTDARLSAANGWSCELK